ncbi:DNA gyrase subunit A [Posidoniimonas corsicana]|uniref:DNA topoisomerase (ATP-hydrolyzing) n=2 Tax=Posidoniimonas corsicana TaxID=1938618 RepID=A0A5C5V3B9_9BACT|nr:DNA gyrase subunit A [Posidoniimonas corsicana]
MADDDQETPAGGPGDGSLEPGFDPVEQAIAQRLIDLPIEDELKDSYLTYAMSVIVSRALPDVRDGLKPSQRRILVAMNDLNLGPGAARVKCAKISGDTSGNYHPHGESVIYPTLVRMAQEWNMRNVLIDKQGNFGSIAGLPPAAMRYTEARMSSVASMMLEDLKLDTVDFIPTYDERHTEPTVLPSKFPNLLVNGSGGIAVGMATSIPPHNLGEVCRGVIALIDNPEITIPELMEHIPGPDFPTGGIICGRSGILRGYQTGRSTMTVRARTSIDESGKRTRILIHEIPYLQARDRVEERIAALANEGKIAGIADVRNESDLKEPVRLIIDLKRDADPDIVLNQLYKYSPLQDTFSLIFLSLVDGKPRVLTLKEMLQEYLRHRVTVIRRRTQFLLAKARRRKHTVQGLLLAHANIDEVIRVIRASKTQPEAKQALMQIKTPGALLKRALGDEGFAQFQDERGVAEEYSLTPVQADAILKMTLGQLVNLEQEKLADEHAQLLTEIGEYLGILADEARIYAIIREDLEALASSKHADARRTEISHAEVGDVDIEDLIEEETMVVSISTNGYIKRTPASTYRAQRRGGKGIKGATVADDDPIEHLFVTSTHHYLLFFTNLGKVYWQKVYNLPELARDSKGRAVVNLLNLADGERIADCRAIRDFDLPDHSLMMATRNGLVKKTELKAYSRPMKTGIIAIKLKEGDELVDVVVTKPGDEVLLATAGGMAIRFNEADARAMGRNSSGVKGVNLGKGDSLVGMVVADPDATLLTATEHGYGKRTPFGPNAADEEPEASASGGAAPEADAPGSPDDESSSSARYRTQGRGGKGVRDIKTTDRNGQVIGITRVTDDDELLMMTARGKIQRIKASDVSTIGRNTQGVRIMGLDEGDSLTAVVRVPAEEKEEDAVEVDAPSE